MKNDKDGSWSIMKRETRSMLVREVLAGVNYEEIVDISQQQIRDMCFHLSKRVVECECGDSRWMSAVNKGW